MKSFTISDISITLSLSDVFDADQYFPSFLKISNKLNYRAKVQRVFHGNVGFYATVPKCVPKCEFMLV